MTESALGSRDDPPEPAPPRPATQPEPVDQATPRPTDPVDPDSSGGPGTATGADAPDDTAAASDAAAPEAPAEPATTDPTDASAADGEAAATSEAVPEGAGEPPRPGAEEPRPPRRSRLGAWLVGLSLGLVAVAGVAVAAVATLAIVEQIRGDAARAEVGDCLDDADTPQRLRRVDCDDADAAWTVVHRVSGIREAEFADAARREELCRPAGEWEVAFWVGEEDGTIGDLLCLRPHGGAGAPAVPPPS